MRASRRLYVGGVSCWRDCGAHGGYETAKGRDIRRTSGGRGLREGAGKRVDEVFPGRPLELPAPTSTSGRLQPRTRGVVQDGRTRCGTFHGEMNRCRESQGWTTACSSIPERDEKDQEEDSPKQAGSCWFARHNS